MCQCLDLGCTKEEHQKVCYCSCVQYIRATTVEKAKYQSSNDPYEQKKCCLFIGCNKKIHVKDCNEYRKCLCLESNCTSVLKHNFPCTDCDQECKCLVYHCDLKTQCCDRKPWQKCRYYAVELCEHCDHLRKRAKELDTYDVKTRKRICKCNCKCINECDGFCQQCDTHSQQGWNLLNWQKYRKPQIFVEMPLEPPYFFEDPKTKKQIKECVSCNKSKSAMRKYDRICGKCFDTVCYDCCSEYEHSHSDTDYDGNCMPFWAFYPALCRKEGH